MKCNRDTHPKLFGYLEAYGLDDSIIAKIDRIKGNASSGYYVVGWPLGDDHVGMLDISNTPDRSTLNSTDMSDFGWNMINDSMTEITEKDWNRIKIAPYCETFTIKDHPEYG